MRLELTTSGTTNQRSNQLSYIRHQAECLILTRFLPKSQVKNRFPSLYYDFPEIFRTSQIYSQKFRDSLGIVEIHGLKMQRFTKNFCNTVFIKNKNVKNQHVILDSGLKIVEIILLLSKTLLSNRLSFSFFYFKKTSLPKRRVKIFNERIKYVSQIPRSSSKRTQLSRY